MGIESYLEEGAGIFIVLLLVFFFLFQLVLTAWSYLRTRSFLAASSTFLIPFFGLPFSLFKQRGELKDNQIGGVVVYLCVIIGIAFFFFALPPDETPWMVIFTMEFFAGLSVLNVINLHVRMS